MGSSFIDGCTYRVVCLESRYCALPLTPSHSLHLALYMALSYMSIFILWKILYCPWMKLNKMIKPVLWVVIVISRLCLYRKLKICRLKVFEIVNILFKVNFLILCLAPMPVFNEFSSQIIYKNLPGRKKFFIVWEKSTQQMLESFIIL